MEKAIMKRKTTTKLLSFNALLSLIVLVIYTLYFAATINYGKSVIVNILFYINGMISLAVLCFFEGFLSIIKIVYCFMFIFFSFAPAVQYSDGVNLWSHVQFCDQDYVTANLMILISELSILGSYCCLKKRKKVKEKPNQDNKFVLNRKIIWIFIVIDLVVLLYEYYKGGLFTFSATSSDTVLSSVQKIIRFLPVATLLLMLFGREDKKLYSFGIFINAVIVGILYFPLAGSVSRFMLFGTYLIIFAKYFKYIKLNCLLPAALIFGFTVVFPAFNFFKTHTINELSQFSFSVGDSLNTVDFDAYQLFLEAVKYVNVKDFTFGANIVSSILFFIPRSVWGGKSVASGELIASFFGGQFTNLSCPYIAEFYLAFGFWGIVLGSVALGLLFKKFEDWFNSKDYLKRGISTIIFGMLIYWLRGAMLPTTAYTMALIISYLIITGVVVFAHKVGVK